MQSPASGSDDDENDSHRVKTASSLTNAHWLRENTQTHQHRRPEDTSPTKAGLAPIGHLSGELGSQPGRRGVLGPLTPLEPLDSLGRLLWLLVLVMSKQ